MDAALNAASAKSEAIAEQRATHVYRDSGDSPDVQCPECGETCKRWPVANVEVDQCAAHGTWYDPGELRRIAEHLRPKAAGTGLELDRPPPIDRTPPPARPSKTPAPDDEKKLNGFVAFLTKSRGPAMISDPDHFKGARQRGRFERQLEVGEPDRSHYRTDAQYDAAMTDWSHDRHGTAFDVADAFFDLGDIW